MKIFILDSKSVVSVTYWSIMDSFLSPDVSN